MIQKSYHQKAFTLIEIAVIMLLISIMLVPVIKNLTVNSPNSGNAASATSIHKTLLTEEQVAKSIMEKALANDPNYHPLIGINSGSPIQLTFNRVTGALSVYAANSYDATANTDSATPYTHVRRQYGDIENTNSGIYFQWGVDDQTYDYSTAVSGNPLLLATPLVPVGNELYKASLNIYSGPDAATKSIPDYTLSSNFFRNDASALTSNNIFNDRVGVVLVLDISHSMKWAQKEADVYGAQEGYCSTYSSTAYGATYNFGQAIFCPSSTGYINESHYTGVSEPWAGAGFTTGSSLYNLPDKTVGNAVALPLRLSSGVSYKYQIASISTNGLYDSLSVASPYLVYRSADDTRTSYDDTDDLYFGGIPTDNPATPYNEAYDPCSSSSSSAFPGGQCAVGITTKNDFRISSSNAPKADSGGNDYIFVDLFESSKAAAILPSNGGSYSGPSEAMDINAFDPPNNDSNCFYTDQNAPFSIGMSYCAATYPDGLYAPGAGVFISALGPDETSDYRIELMASNAAPQTIEWSMSRLESARTAMLSFLKTIEANTQLADNFSIGLVTFSSAIGDTLPLEDISGGGTFTNLNSTLKRVNRACKVSAGGSSYLPACPADELPIVPTAGTNISEALNTARNLLNADSTLATRMIILLTDGKPDSTDADSSFRSQDINGIKSVADVISKNNGVYGDEDDIIVYTVGLLTGTDTTAQNVLKVIADPTPAQSKGESFFSESVGNLTPVFEAIARQAELFALNNIKKRYNNIDMQ